MLVPIVLIDVVPMPRQSILSKATLGQFDLRGIELVLASATRCIDVVAGQSVHAAFFTELPASIGASRVVRLRIQASELTIAG